ncbi:hypothetical protein BDV97DRAFT_346139 [Delphinella strobiligena]|nr:hypothetical protein BDV97DRAFT_346139 [Delphinella strobiligena]
MDFCTNDWCSNNSEVFRGCRPSECIALTETGQNSAHTKAMTPALLTMVTPTLSQSRGCDKVSLLQERPHAITFVNLPPEIRNRIYELVLTKPTATVIHLESDWKQPALSLTCHQIQTEMLSFWLGYYKYNFWPDRHGEQFAFSPFMKRWMTRAGPDAAKIHHLEVNARMPDLSRFCWEILVDRDAKAKGTVRKVSLAAKYEKDTVLKVTSVPLNSTSTDTKEVVRSKSSKSTVQPRNHVREESIAKKISNAICKSLRQNGTGFIGIDEIEAVMAILRNYGVKTPLDLTCQNPSWPAHRVKRYVPPPASNRSGQEPSGRIVKPRSQRVKKVRGRTNMRVAREGSAGSVRILGPLSSTPKLPTSEDDEFCSAMSKLSLTEWPNPAHKLCKWLLRRATPVKPVSLGPKSILNHGEYWTMETNSSDYDRILDVIHPTVGPNIPKLRKASREAVALAMWFTEAH